MSPADRFRALLAGPEFLVLPAIWDGLGARLAARAGFPAAFVSGSCVAAGRLGGPDLDLVSFGELADSVAMIRAAAPELALLVDADHGFGNPVNVRRSVRSLAAAGAAAVLVEDKLSPRPLDDRGKPCVARAEALDRARAAIDAAHEAGILLLARTDCRPSLGLDEALARIEAFVALGADMVFLESPADEDELRRAVRAAGPCPSFTVLSPGSGRVSVDARRAAELGLRLGSHHTGLLAPVVAAFADALAALRAGAQLPARPDLRTLLGYEDYAREAARYR